MNNHPHTKVIELLKENGVKITGSECAYKLLYKLTKFRGHPICHNKIDVARELGVKGGKVNKIAKDLLTEFQDHGMTGLYLPNAFYIKTRGFNQ